jgi:diguanylate cyclase (GGDEF)-like protein
VLIPECSKEKAVVKTREFVALVAGYDIVLRREKTRITVSAGVAAFPEDAKTREDLIQKADAALYEAKKTGRDRVCVV